MAFSYAGAVASIDKRKAKDREDFLRLEDLANSRENSFLQLHLSSLKEKSTFKNSPAAIAAASDAIKFKSRISDDESLSVEQRDIYNGIATTDPFAAQELYNFQNEQALKFQRNLNLSQIFDLVTINSMESPIEEKMETVKATTDIDFRNKKEYIEAMESLVSINKTPGRLTLIDFDSASNVDAAKLMDLESKQLNNIMGKLEIKVAQEIENQLKIQKNSEDDVVKRAANKKILSLQEAQRNRSSKDITLSTNARMYYLTFLNEDMLNEFIASSPEILSGAKNIHEIKEALKNNQATDPSVNTPVTPSVTLPVTPSVNIPTFEDYKRKALIKNPGASDEEIRRRFNERFGQQDG